MFIQVKHAILGRSSIYKIFLLENIISNAPRTNPYTFTPRPPPINLELLLYQIIKRLSPWATHHDRDGFEGGWTRKTS
jgi:hypothetical protein